MTEEQIKAKAKEQFPNDEFKQQAVIDAINWATKELQKENAELKNVERMALYSKLSDQLTKAKELLNEFMRISKASDEDFEHDYSELIGEAEQFLKEVNK